jgi:hypothetical protein
VQLAALLDTGPWGAWKHRPGGVFLLRGDRMSDAERTLLAAAARAILSGERGELANQPDRPYAELQWERELPTPPPMPIPESDFMSGWFTKWSISTSAFASSSNNAVDWAFRRSTRSATQTAIATMTSATDVAGMAWAIARACFTSSRIVRVAKSLGSFWQSIHARLSSVLKNSSSLASRLRSIPPSIIVGWYSLTGFAVE